MAARMDDSDKSLPSFMLFNDVASKRNGGKILFATDDFFAVAENLIKDGEPEWRDGIYTEFGKWMDGWETRRKRIPGQDYCIIGLAAPSVIKGVELNTAFFTGNHAPRVSIQAAFCQRQEFQYLRRKSVLGSSASATDLEETLFTRDWEEILPLSTLQPGYADSCRNFFGIASDKVWSHLRLNLYPDGGISRLRVFGHVQTPHLWGEGEIIDLVSFKNGGECVGCSNAHFGHPRNLIRTDNALSMADGWETARRLDRPMILELDKEENVNYEGCSEWCILKFGVEGYITEVVIDTTHFKGNYPDRVRLEGFSDDHWIEILPFQELKGHSVHNFHIESDLIFSEVRMTVVPDGGISRLRVNGIPKSSYHPPC